MVRIESFKTTTKEVTLFCEAGVRFYLREEGVHCSLQEYATREDAKAEFQRLEEQSIDNGEHIMTAIYSNDCEVVF